MLLKFRKLMRQPIKQQKVDKILLDGNSLVLDDLIKLTRYDAKIEIAQNSWQKLSETRAIVEKLSKQDEPVYGITTGFGRFSNVKIPYESLIDLQYNLIRSHATGVGKILPLEAAQRVTALRINTLAKGYSGCSLETVERLVDMFNAGCVPWIPDQGSVGASGDLVPLAHIGYSLIGEGKVWNPNSQRYEHAEKVFQELGIKKAELKAKDGLSLINGTQFICGVGSIAVEKAIVAIKSATVISALSFLALKGHADAFDERIQDIRIHYGQKVIGEVMRELIPYGKNVENKDDVQDPYSMRCITQVLGPSFEGVFFSKEGIEIEMNTGSDNPLVFSDKEPHIISGGNFHGEFPAKQLDVLAMYTHEIASISFMRAKRLLNPTKSLGMPAFLTNRGGTCSGLMTWENVAASLVSENKVLCHPSSIDTAETCADKEDHVSMGAFSARKACTVSENVLSVLAVELLAVAHALQYRFEHEPEFSIYHPGLKKVYEKIKSISPPLYNDRYTVPEFNKIKEYITSGDMWDTVQAHMGTTNYGISFAHAESDHSEKLRILQVPRDNLGNLKYTKMRELQTQAGQIQKLGLSYDSISEDELKEAIMYYKKHSKVDNVISILDASQDDLGARANFGRGNITGTEDTAYEQFLQKFSNFQVNKFNQDAIQQCLLIGSIDIQDLKEQCKNKNPLLREERLQMIEALRQLDERSRRIVKTVFNSNSKLFYMNGDHNNMGYIVSGFFQSRKVKPVVIYLDVHSDARVREDGPHSGTWMSEIHDRGECQQAYVIGLSYLSNSEAAMSNLEKNNVQFQDYTWDEIQRRGGSSKAIPQMTEQIINDIKQRFGKNYPVILSICADTVSGLPCSASNEVVGYPSEDIYPMMSKMIQDLNVECLNVSELKPSLDKNKNNASGEFLSYSLYMYSQTLIKKNK